MLDHPPLVGNLSVVWDVATCFVWLHSTLKLPIYTLRQILNIAFFRTMVFRQLWGAELSLEFLWFALHMACIVTWYLHATWLTISMLSHLTLSLLQAGWSLH